LARDAKVITGNTSSGTALTLTLPLLNAADTQLQYRVYSIDGYGTAPALSAYANITFNSTTKASLTPIVFVVPVTASTGFTFNFTWPEGIPCSAYLTGSTPTAPSITLIYTLVAGNTGTPVTIPSVVNLVVTASTERA
jgi:hypothetical protein